MFLDKISDSESNFLATSFLVHYHNLLDNDLDINLEFLKKDLAFLETLYPNTKFSKLIIYYLGRRLDEGYLNYLYNAKNIDQLQSNVFDISFFSKLRKEQLSVLDSNLDEIEFIVNDVKAKAEEIEHIYNESLNKPQELKSITNTSGQNTNNDESKTTEPQSEEQTANSSTAGNVSSVNDSENKNTESNTDPDQPKPEPKGTTATEYATSNTKATSEPIEGSPKLIDYPQDDSANNRNPSPCKFASR
nr:hypothetical protein [Psychrobacter sp. PraFG1]UNK06015.1 hypothetical protein MN210_04785 [Psychrobacter sp. PraFG1]